MLDKITINELGEVEILLKIEKNFVKIKNICLSALQEIPWIKSLNIKMAPKVSNMNFKIIN
jgi:hypothetical protein